VPKSRALPVVPNDWASSFSEGLAARGIFLDFSGSQLDVAALTLGKTSATYRAVA